MCIYLAFPPQFSSTRKHIFPLLFSLPSLGTLKHVWGLGIQERWVSFDGKSSSRDMYFKQKGVGLLAKW